MDNTVAACKSERLFVGEAGGRRPRGEEFGGRTFKNWMVGNHCLVEHSDAMGCDSGRRGEQYAHTKQQHV